MPRASITVTIASVLLPVTVRAAGTLNCHVHGAHGLKHEGLQAWQMPEDWNEEADAKAASILL